MDGRTAKWLTCGLLIAVAVGCTNSVTNPGIPQTPPPPKSPKPPEPSPDTLVTKRDKLGEPKPAYWVELAGVKAELATNPKHTPAEKEAFANQAKDFYAKALKLDPKHIPAYMGVAALYESMGQNDEALSSYRATLQLDPKNQSAHIAVARVLERSRKFDEALATYAAAIKAMPREPALWFEMGACYARLKQFDRALECGVKAAELRPNNPDYCKWVGFMLARMGRTDEALDWLARAYPESEAEAHYQLAGLLYKTGRDDACRAQLDIVLKLEPNHEMARKMSAQLPPLPASPIRTAAARSDEPVATPLPTRPMVIQTAGQPRPLPPLMPVATDQFDNKSAPPSLTKPAPGKGPTVRIDFDAGP